MNSNYKIDIQWTWWKAFGYLQSFRYIYTYMFSLRHKTCYKIHLSHKLILPCQKHDKKGGGFKRYNYIHSGVYDFSDFL